jgi:hypothetical protein
MFLEGSSGIDSSGVAHDLERRLMLAPFWDWILYFLSRKKFFI